MKTQNLKHEFSSGCVVFKKQSPLTNYLFLLGKHSGYHKWVLAKGLIEKGETNQQTAIRETEEEMGVKVKILSPKPIYIAEYVYFADFKDPKKNKSTRRVKKYQEDGGGKIKVFKTVTFYLAQYVSGSPKNHGWEMEDSGWFKYQQALKIMAFKEEKETLEKARKQIEKL